MPEKTKRVDFVYLPGMYEAEKRLAGMIRNRVGNADRIDINIINDQIDAMEKNLRITRGDDFTLAPEQREAVINALRSKISVITGGPGRGKSETTRFIVRGYESIFPERNLYLAAPTGRAAKRLSEATGKEASTIHRLLQYHPEFGFRCNEECPLAGPGMLLVDEFSMTDIELAYNLFRALPDNMQVVIIGDVNQLPSVGPGMVLRDIIESGIVPVSWLKYNHRQEKNSTISYLADRICQGKADDLREVEARCGGADFRFIEAATQEEAAQIIKNGVCREAWNGRWMMDYQVLTPMRERGAAAADKINMVIQYMVNPPDEVEGRSDELEYGGVVFRLFDKVMVVKNDYDKEVFNGDLGIVSEVKSERKAKGLFVEIDERQVWFGLDELCKLQLAYAYTVHKSQGGEFPLVVLVCIRSHAILLTRPLIYTGITRAKKKLVIVGQQEAFEMAVKNNRIHRRGGLLKERLQGVI
jgi:exodeoxyribonuclease V alpha subunit